MTTELPSRTARQIIGPDGKSAEGTLTSNLWVNSQQAFAACTEGNLAKSFTSGKAYFADLILAMDAAHQEICITGWAVAWDAQLAEGVRLYDVLLRAALDRNVAIYVLPWKHTNPLQTYDAQTAKVLLGINAKLKKLGKPKRVFVKSQASLSGVNSTYFSHHQKQVVIDRKIAYIGGLDLYYGRYDDDTYDLVSGSESRNVNDRYNPCIPPLGILNEADPKIVDPDLLTGALDNIGIFSDSHATAVQNKIDSGAHQVPYAENSPILNSAKTDGNTPSYACLDETIQPRMPWQDIHARIEGPAVSDLLRNFVLRWNTATGNDPRLPLPAAPSKYEKKGNAFIQVLRSAPANMCAAETKANPGVVLKASGNGAQTDIYTAMLQLIEKSRHFIYIENQFFVSNFGEIVGPGRSTAAPLSPVGLFIKNGAMGIGDTSLWALRKLDEQDADQLDRIPQNRICEALCKRIQRAILDKSRPNFHVYMTLPVHPEGMLANASIAVQVFWTMQSLVFGRFSLLNGIRRSLKARQLRDAGDMGYMRAIDQLGNTEYEDIPIEDCFNYVTLLNLRNWACLPGKDRYVTEQIYVHSKLMIVDDMYALLGSANINDRSLLGERDSEIAVLIMDGDSSRADINGKGSQRPVRAFAHELRKSVWRKIFGIAGGVNPASHLGDAIDAPGIPDSWRRIQAQAEKNASAYEAVFPFIPRNFSSDSNDKKLPAHILPTWVDFEGQSGGAAGGALESPLPYEKIFWASKQHNSQAVELLRDIKGYFTALPIHWTREDNLRIRYPTALVADNKVPSDFSPLKSDGGLKDHLETTRSSVG